MRTPFNNTFNTRNGHKSHIHMWHLPKTPGSINYSQNYNLPYLIQGGFKQILCVEKKLTSPKMFGLKHMNFEFPPTLDQKMHLLTLEAKDFLWGPEKKRREERFLLMKSARKADDLWCIFLDWDSKFGKLLQNAPCFLVFCIMPWIGSCCYWTKVCLRSQYVPRLSGPYENIKALIHAS